GGALRARERGERQLAASDHGGDYRRNPGTPSRLGGRRRRHGRGDVEGDRDRGGSPETRRKEREETPMRMKGSFNRRTGKTKSRNKAKTHWGGGGRAARTPASGKSGKAAASRPAKST